MINNNNNTAAANFQFWASRGDKASLADGFEWDPFFGPPVQRKKKVNTGPMEALGSNPSSPTAALLMGSSNKKNDDDRHRDFSSDAGAATGPASAKNEEATSLRDRRSTNTFGAAAAAAASFASRATSFGAQSQQQSLLPQQPHQKGWGQWLLAGGEYVLSFLPCLGPNGITAGVNTVAFLQENKPVFRLRDAEHVKQRPMQCDVIAEADQMAARREETRRYGRVEDDDSDGNNVAAAGGNGAASRNVSENRSLLNTNQ